MSLNEPVPQPPLKPIVGNLTELQGGCPVQSLMALARTYGPFFKLTIMDRDVHVASSQELVNELCDETRFGKRIQGALKEIRAVAGDGLFTAYGHEPNWAKAHRILVPAFGPIAIRGMFDRMLDIADQMFVRWERFGPSAVIEVADNMTRLTLDTIALCAFDYRFNSFYQDDMHPFVSAMVGTLQEASNRARRPKLLSSLMLSKARQFQVDKEMMDKVARDLIAERRRDPRGNEKNDLLNLMLNGVDPVTGEKLSDENIGYQMITFLIAGHETTSGLLSFATYLLLKNPDVLQKARALVDEVLGEETPRVEHLAQLRYIEQILMETLRIWPTASVFSVSPHKDTVLAGKYPLTTKDIVMVLEPMLHRDPKVWGDDVEAFRPERFAPENASQLPPNAWKPFGNGARACIGRPFAMQEAQLVLILMLQRFDFVLDDPSYTLKIHETLTLKPEGLRIRARARRTGTSLRRSAVPSMPQKALTSQPARRPAADAASTPLLILYGSNTGSSEAFANRIADEAPANGFAPTVAAMDDYAANLPREGAIVVVTASYEGQPPDNARQFVSSVEALQEGALTGARFAVFGCGNRQWARTYQAIPKRVDAALARAGASRLAERGETDSGGDFFGAFDEWWAGFLPRLREALGKEAAAAPAASSLQVEFVKDGREGALRLGDLQRGSVVENRELVDMSAPKARSKRHLEFSLPAGMSYRAGDYLAVLATNPQELVDRVLRRFGLARDTLVVLRRDGVASLPIGRTVSCGELLSNYVELAQPATRAQVAALAAATPCPPEQAELEAMAGEAYATSVLKPRCSVLDLLDRFQSCALGFGPYLDMLPPMRARQYSISSSPLWKPDHVTLTVAVVDAPAYSGTGTFRGVASSYLAHLQPGDRISLAVRPSNARFHPPADPRTPLILICAGSGIAPFRGFLQERATQKQAGQEVGPALLFFGTNHADVDYLYRDELERWEAAGVVTVLPAFSLQPRGEVSFVQHRVWEERARIVELFQRGGSVFVCGDGQHMAPGVRETLVRIYREASGVSEADAQKWVEVVEHEHGRYVSDVFA
ncbi:cytochrome P450 [Reyranella sp.]|jgi:cytochrome P450/NADPH-cytochrome P450 reductase|uniref:bifunctional cytochrome P450/NADPH--P450 reductase n=1 Tax=Reyranella sp. TaxID=1929291 RepID=UPI000BC7E9A0|nr:cytochrome P450 [Reyranella sp.]OYY42072.1 MAG: cytochrome [Rhodospirillales bacterium 35-66-84]OYZ93853.1 MAG: cytochrome [Rhodospirillales bacterium 24-66-33]OZB25103.1 MAG: cytochrome [Rhodospirillales bacterium 39-66-50]HQS17960.1 cytochrome P450 [Reyranella sp.]HQT10603.1 cytochrome P450 [Reyranella sp.]